MVVYGLVAVGGAPRRQTLWLLPMSVSSSLARPSKWRVHRSLCASASPLTPWSYVLCRLGGVTPAICAESELDSSSIHPAAVQIASIARR